MTRLLVHVEGQTEETFVNCILAPHLYEHGYTLVSARLIGNARQRDHRGGIAPWPAARRDIIRHLREDRGCIATTMVDYYAMPQLGAEAWPGRTGASSLPQHQRANAVEQAMAADIPADIDTDRFVPYLNMHEFEALLFSDCAACARGMDRPDLEAALTAIRAQFGTPEDINDSSETAPSKRFEALIPGYQKVLTGNLAALEIGLAAMRRECPHFREWLERLETHRLLAGA